MFDFFRSKTRDEFIEEGRRMYGQLPEPKKAPPMPSVNEMKQPRETYRIGFDSDGLTTITFMDDSVSMTLSLTEAGCERMIRMIRSTYQPSEDEQ